MKEDEVKNQKMIEEFLKHNRPSVEIKDQTPMNRVHVTPSSTLGSNGSTSGRKL